jgi:putative Mg2+ transporter-C (MgtC) family protein
MAGRFQDVYRPGNESEHGACDTRDRTGSRLVEPYVILPRLLLAALCSGLIGFEREAAQKTAGLRTHTLVGVGAAMFTIASITSFEGVDESRVAAQIVTGVGFLGAGAIFRDGAFVKGLTTAAGLWVVASIGMAAGSGSYWLAILGTVVTLGTFFGLRAVDDAIARRKATIPSRLEITIDDASKLDSLLKFIKRIHPESERLDFKKNKDDTAVLVVSCSPAEVAMVTDILRTHKVVTKVSELSPLYWPQEHTREHRP